MALQGPSGASVPSNLCYPCYGKYQKQTDFKVESVSTSLHRSGILLLSCKMLGVMVAHVKTSFYLFLSFSKMIL